MKTPLFTALDRSALLLVAGGAKSGSANQEITRMLTDLTSSIKDLGNKKNSGGDSSMMLMMVMMMGGMGGGGGGGAPAQAAPPLPPPPVVNISTSVRR